MPGEVVTGHLYVVAADAVCVWVESGREFGMRISRSLRIIVSGVAAVLLLSSCGVVEESEPVDTGQASGAAEATLATEAETGAAETMPAAAGDGSSDDPTSDDSDQVDEPAAEDAAVRAAESSDVARIMGLLDSLVVADEFSGGYDRELFKHWVDADGDGCDARREVLIAEAVVAPNVVPRCTLSDGEWLSRYDGKTTAGNGSGFDVDHMVPLAEAWESGAHGWTAERREEYANDLGYADSLVAVSKSSNRSKGARDPAEWMPPSEGVHCWYAAAWAQVKTRWSLTADPAEISALRGVLSGCTDSDLDDVPEADSAGTPEPAGTADSNESDSAAAQAEPEPAGDCHPAYEPCLPNEPGDALNCGDLTADQKPVRVKQIGVDPYRLDRDEDGTACTS